MCGIVAYAGTKDAAPLVLDLLERLEYRGYDSCGIAVLSGDDVLVRRMVGRVSEVRESVALQAPSGNVAIGHTRWATHGKVSTKNSHPFSSCDGTIVAAHNGVIDISETSMNLGIPQDEVEHSMIRLVAAGKVKSQHRSD